MEESEGHLTPAEKEAGRLESFSDGVFAVAITLLVLNLVVPELRTPTAGALATALSEKWPSYLAFVTSFGTILEFSSMVRPPSTYSLPEMRN